MKFPLAKETINRSDIEDLIVWLSDNPRLTMGEVVEEFEEKWAEWIGTKYAVYVNSGSSANLLMVYILIAMGLLKPGDEVAVPAVGWGTTVAPIMQFGLKPVVFDVNRDNFGIDTIDLEAYIKENPGKIKAIMYVNVLGIPADIRSLQMIAEEYDLYLFEDSCAALGSKYYDVRLGNFGDMSSFSFYFGHQLSTIEGGMINTNNFEYYEYLKMARSHGWLKDVSNETKNEYYNEYEIDSFHEPFTFVIPGFNLRATDLQAEIGLGQMKKADLMAVQRHIVHMRYFENLKNKIAMQYKIHSHVISSISFGAVAKNSEERKRIVEALNEHEIETRLFSAGNLGLHPFFTGKIGSKNGQLKNADWIHNGGFFLPNYPELKSEDVDYISNVVLDVLDDKTNNT
jgi:CDP-6-deoxy-D-xylo-4-hexulose-3-dehydrase